MMKCGRKWGGLGQGASYHHPHTFTLVAGPFSCLVFPAARKGGQPDGVDVMNSSTLDNK